MTFLKALSEDDRVIRVGKRAHDSVLIHAIESFVELMSDYMSSVYRLIEPSVLEDFRAALYKGWALQCGVHLGACFFLGDQETKAKLQWINGELSRGI